MTENGGTKIKTLVFFDCEATGLKSSGKPRITEISLVATNVDHFEDLHTQINTYLQAKYKTSHNEQSAPKQPFSDIELALPRVLNKLTLCIFPMKTIYPNVTQITGLDNYNLEGQSNFSSATHQSISSFLSLLEKPVCLLAHNGDKYDFPLLQAELNRISESFEKLDLFCCDTYQAIKDIYSPSRTSSQNIQAELEAVQELLANGVFDDEMDIEGVKCYQEDVSLTNFQEEDNVLLSPRTLSSKRSSVEELLMTPPSNTRKRLRSSSQCTDTPGKNSSAQATSHLDNGLVHPSENEVTPYRQTGVGSVPGRPTRASVGAATRDKGKVKKRLAFEPGTGTPSSFSLPNLHNHFLGFPPRVSHGAESDCLSLLRVTAAIGPKFLTWLQQNSQSFQECKAMW